MCWIQRVWMGLWSRLLWDLFCSITGHSNNALNKGLCFLVLGVFTLWWRHKGWTSKSNLPEQDGSVCIHTYHWTRQQDQSLSVIIHDRRFLWSGLWCSAEPWLTCLQQFLATVSWKHNVHVEIQPKAIWSWNSLSDLLLTVFQYTRKTGPAACR